ncbi:unnamed protein product, partial [marine sediment metagenome]
AGSQAATTKASDSLYGEHTVLASFSLLGTYNLG